MTQPKPTDPADVDSCMRHPDRRATHVFKSTDEFGRHVENRSCDECAEEVLALLREWEAAGRPNVN